MNQQPEDLRGCPFCLGLATLEKIEDGCYGVGCSDCDFQLMNGSVGIGWHESEQEAITAWNERGGDLAMSQLQAWVKELQAENVALKISAPSQCLLQIQEPAVNQQLTTEQEPVAWLVKRSQSVKLPGEKYAEDCEWLEEADEPGQEGSFPVYAAPVLAAQPATNHSETPNSSTITVPRGWKLVPDDATPEWIANLESSPVWSEAVGECIKKFLAAAPSAPQAAPAAVAVPDAIPPAFLHYAEKKAELHRVDFLPMATKAERNSGWVTVELSAALAATPAADDLEKQLKDVQESLAFYQKRCELLQGVQSKMRDPERTIVCDVLANGHLLKNSSGELDYVRYAVPAAAPVVLPEPDAYVNPSDLSMLARKESAPKNKAWMFYTPHPELIGVYSVHTLRALLATGGQAHAERQVFELTVNQMRQAIEFATGGFTPDTEAELETSMTFSFGPLQDDDGKVTEFMHCWYTEMPEEGAIPLDECPTEKDLAAAQAPQQADARDADGEAFRTAARLGLTLRFYGNCAQSGLPGAPSVYEVTAGPDSAEAMRASIDRAAIAIAAAKGE